MFCFLFPTHLSSFHCRNQGTNSGGFWHETSLHTSWYLWNAKWTCSSGDGAGLDAAVSGGVRTAISNKLCRLLLDQNLRTGHEESRAQLSSASRLLLVMRLPSEQGRHRGYVPTCLLPTMNLLCPKFLGESHWTGTCTQEYNLRLPWFSLVPP